MTHRIDHSVRKNGCFRRGFAVVLVVAAALCGLASTPAEASRLDTPRPPVQPNVPRVAPKISEAIKLSLQIRKVKEHELSLEEAEGVFFAFGSILTDDMLDMIAEAEEAGEAEDQQSGRTSDEFVLEDAYLPYQYPFPVDPYKGLDPYPNEQEFRRDFVSYWASSYIGGYPKTDELFVDGLPPVGFEDLGGEPPIRDWDQTVQRTRLGIGRNSKSGRDKKTPKYATTVEQILRDVGASVILD